MTRYRPALALFLMLLLQIGIVTMFRISAVRRQATQSSPEAPIPGAPQAGEKGGAPEPPEKAAPPVLGSSPAPTPKGAEPSGASPYDLYARVDRVLAAMDSANIAFNSPGVMNLRDTALIELLLSLQKTAPELSAELTAPGAHEGASIKVSNRMEARLSGTNFQITAMTPEEQAVGHTDTVQWKWEIQPLATGRQKLHLTLTAVIVVDGATTRRAVRTFDREIEIEVTLAQSVSAFVGKNWQWLWAAILLPIGGWLWKRWTVKSRGSKPPDA